MFSSSEKTISQYYNYLAIRLLEFMGNDSPTQEQINIIEEVIASSNASRINLTFSSKLNDKEIACLYWAAQGKSSAQTAKIMRMSKSSVELYRKNIKKKLNCTNITQSVFEALKQGYLFKDDAW
jgi:DNA-binding CsgD family transcriptional regulator